MQTMIDFLEGLTYCKLSVSNAPQSGQRMYLPLNLPDDEQTYYWLYWLASKLKQDNTAEFSIESIQPFWLESALQRRVYQILVGLSTGLLIGLIYGLTTGWMGAGIGGVSYGLILGFTQEIYPVARMKFSLEYARFQLLKSVLEGLWWGLIYGVIDAFICQLIWGGDEGMWGMIQAMIWGLVEGLIWGVCVPEFNNVNNVTIRNYGIRESAKNAAVFTLIGGVGWMLLYVLVLMGVNEPLDIYSVFLDGVSSGLFFGIYVGGLACVQHFVVRLILWWNGCIPWNYAQFLDYAASRGLLERDGRCYRLHNFRYSLRYQHFPYHSEVISL
jgi:hypothetical protein